MNILGYTGPNSKREIVQIDQPAVGPVENPAWNRDGYLLNGTFSSLRNIARRLGNCLGAIQNSNRAKVVQDQTSTFLQ
jgi:hypothetical protein